MTRIVVDLPAPFGPTNPVTWPGCTVNVIPSRAIVGPNRLRSPVTSMVASAISAVLSRLCRRFQNWLYGTAGVSTVSAADTGLTPVTWHCLTQVT